jgi:hypothetical protein
MLRYRSFVLSQGNSLATNLAGSRLELSGEKFIEFMHARFQHE